MTAFFYRHNVVPSQILPMSHKSVLKVIWFIRTYDFTCTHHLWICLFDVFSNIVQKYDTSTMFNNWFLLLFSSSTQGYIHLFQLVFNVVIICHLLYNKYIHFNRMQSVRRYQKQKSSCEEVKHIAITNNRRSCHSKYQMWYSDDVKELYTECETFKNIVMRII